MAVRAHEHAIAAGETLIADLRDATFPLGWAADLPSGVTLTHDFSNSDEPGDWLTPATNESITATVADYEEFPLRFLRWRHTVGADPATIRIAATGRVYWKVSS